MIGATMLTRTIACDSGPCDCTTSVRKRTADTVDEAKMYLIYTDEAGNTGRRRDPDQPLHMIGAMIVEDRKVDPLASQFLDIVAKRFPNLYFLDGFEMHGSAVFGGSDLFKGEKPEVRLGACHDVFDLLVSEEIDFMWTAVDKIKSTSTQHPHSLAFKFLAERLEDYLKPRDTLGLIVADENKEMEQKLVDDLVRYKQSSTNWGYRPTQITRIIDSVHFVQSKNNSNIQIVDLVTYFISKAVRTLDHRFDTFQAGGHGMSYSEYIRDVPSKPALRAVLDLYEKIRPRVVTSHRWPR